MKYLLDFTKRLNSNTNQYIVTSQEIYKLGLADQCIEIKSLKIEKN